MASEWQPMSEAPKDGTAVWLAGDWGVAIGYFDPPDGFLHERGRWFLKASFTRSEEKPRIPDAVFGTYAIINVEPTCWMPLPNPPENPDGK